MLGISRTFLYRSYKEWRQGEATRWATVIEANSGTVPLGFGSFEQERFRLYERHFLLAEEDLKMTFKRWMRTNLRKLTVNLAVDYLNTKLLCTVDENTLLAHRVYSSDCKDYSLLLDSEMWCTQM